MAMASHRPTQSISSNNLLPPTTPDRKQERRMTSPNLGQRSGRPPSPLRNGFVPSSSTGVDPYAVDDDEDDNDDDDDDEDDERGRHLQRSPSPSSSVSQIAASFAQRVGNFVGGMAPRSPSLLPSDAELEAEAEIERDRTRREAEQILRHEAGERKLLEDRVLALMENTRPPPPPPSRSQTMSNPPSPSSSQKDGGSWWTAAKNKLTPTKELTPAQQVIQDAKTREKETKKLAKGKEKEKEWPSNMQQQLKYPDPTLLNLNTPQQPRRPAPGSPASPTPSRSTMAPNLSPSPMRSGEAGSSSPSREVPPLYAQFNAQGTLDVHVTLLTIAKRFEKLEKWTVGHVRALEERMGDVERWLVDKEKEKEDATVSSQRAAGPTSFTSEAVSEEMRELREEIVELQGRIGEIGREMARMAIAPGKLSSTMSRQSAEATVSPSTGSPSIQHERVTSSAADIIDPDTTTPHTRTRVPSVTARHSTSPPMTSSKASAGTRLPYPTGDYAPDPSISGFFSPTSSPPSSVGKAHPMSTKNTTGLPAATSPSNANTQQPPLSSSASSSYSLASYSSTSSISPIIPGYNPTNGLTSPSSSPASRLGKPSSRGLPVPPTHKTSPSLRQSSASPTPRKRYTVALGGPIVPPDDFEEQKSSSRNRPTTPHSSRGRYMSSPANDYEMEGNGNGNGNGNDHRVDDDDDEQGYEFQDETIGKSKSGRMAIPITSGTRSSNGEGVTPTSIPKSLPSSPSNPRKVRAQSAYGFSAIQAQSPNTMGVLGGGGDLSLPSVAPLKPKLRSKSSERLERGGGGNGFVDPLVLRKQEAAGNLKMAMPKPVGKVPVGQLVAFFDGERK